MQVPLHTSIRCSNFWVCYSTTDLFCPLHRFSKYKWNTRVKPSLRLDRVGGTLYQVNIVHVGSKVVYFVKEQHFLLLADCPLFVDKLGVGEYLTSKCQQSSSATNQSLPLTKWLIDKTWLLWVMAFSNVLLCVNIEIALI